MAAPTPVPERVALTVRAEELPKEIAAKFAGGPIPGLRHLVTAEPAEESDEEKLAALRQAVNLGRQQLAAGQGVDGETLFARLRPKYQVTSAN